MGHIPKGVLLQVRARTSVADPDSHGSGTFHENENETADTVSKNFIDN